MDRPKIILKKDELPSGAVILDSFSGALKELFFISHPELKKGMPQAQEALDNFLASQNVEDIWIYYPWRNLAVHTLSEKLYFKLRTSRNRNIINEEEQWKYRNTKVGIAGLSVGSGILSALVMGGGPKILKIADFDTVEISNLNRIRAKLTDLGTNKTDVAAREVWELDPFADLHLWPEGINKENLQDFIRGEPELDIFIDEMDSIDIKILSRFVCRDNKIPVIMATDNGDGIILDVERFDLESDRPIFHGLVDLKPEEVVNIDFKKWIQLATKIVGPEYLTERMQESLLAIGKDITAVPQLGTSATIAGAAVSYVVRRIANKQPMPSGRYLISLEEKIAPEYNSLENIESRKIKTLKFKEGFLKR